MSRIYLIGTGVIAREHAKAVSLLSSGPHEIVVHDANPEALASFLKEFPHARAVDNAEALFAEAPREDDIVVVATPPSSHAALACRALESGRHTLCEKPLAISQEEVNRMFETAKRCGRHLGCCSDRFLGYAATEEVKRLYKKGVVGTPYHLACVRKQRRARSGIDYQPQSRWFLNRALSGGGPSMDWSVYDFASVFDVIRPVSVTIESAWMNRAVTEADPSPDVVFDVETHFGAAMRCVLEDGATIHLDYERSSCTHGEERSFLELEGTRGAIKWNYLPGHQNDLLEVRNASFPCLMTDKEGKPQEKIFALDESSLLSCHAHPLVYFHKLLLGEASLALVDARAKFNISVILGIIQAAQTGRAVKVEIDR